MEKFTLNLINRLLVLLLILVGSSAFAQVTLSVRYSAVDSKYHVYMTPTAGLSATANPTLTDGSSTITLITTTGSLTVGTVTSVNPGGSWGLSTTARNNGDGSSGAPTATDFFVFTPAGDFASIAYTPNTEVELFNFDVTGTCSGSLGILNVAGQPTAAGGSLNIGTYYSVKGYAGGIGTNHFTSTYNISASCPVSATPDLITTIGQPTTPLTAGQTSNIPITTTNAGGASANGPILTSMTLPTGTSAPASFTSGTSSCATTGQLVECSTPGSLSNTAPNNTVVINVPVTPNASTVGTSPQFTGTSSAPNEPAGNITNNPATPMTPTAPIAGVPDLVTNIGQPTTPLTVGQISNIPLTTTNIGSAPANGPITSSMTLPTGTSAPASFTSGTSSCTTTGQMVSCTTPSSLSQTAPNNTFTINVPVTPSASTVGTTPQFNGTSSAPNEPVNNTTNNNATPTSPATPVAGVPDLITTIGQPSTPLTVGQTSNVPMTTTNIGSAPANDPIISGMTLPTGTSAPASFMSGTSSCTTNGQIVSCSTPGPLSQTAPNNTVTIDVPVTPNASIVGTTPTFNGTSSAPNEPASNTGNNGATPTTTTIPVAGVPDLVTSVGQPSPALTVGQVSNIPMTTTNIGTAPAVGTITTTMTLPTGVSAPASFTSGSSSCTTSALTVTCLTAGPLSQTAPNNAFTVNVPVTPSASTTGTTPQFNATSSAPNEPAANTGNNGATPMTPTTPVANNAAPDLVTSIGQPTSPLTVGQVSNVPITTTNVGTAPANGPITTTFNVPTGMTTPASFTSGTSTCGTSGQVVTCFTPGPFSQTAPNNSVTINVPVTPLASTAGTTPQFTGSSSAPNEPVTNTGNNNATPMTPTTPVQVITNPDLVTTVGQPATPLIVGQVSNIPMTTSNVGTGPATGTITSTMTLPTGVSAPASFVSGNSTCSTMGQTVTCFTSGPLSQTAPNNAFTINVPVTPSASTAGTTPQFMATSSAPNEPASNTGNNGSTPMTPTTPVQTVSAPDLVTSVGQPLTPLTVGQVSNIPMTTSNVGTGPATGTITSTMTLPTGVSAPASFVSGNSTCSTSGQTVTCFTPGPLSQTAPNNAFTINVPATPSASTAGTTPSFTATSSAPNEPASNTGNNGSTPMTPTTPVQTVSAPDLVTSVGQPLTPLTVGQVSNLPVTTTNIGSAPATGPITSTMTLPTGVSAPASFTNGSSTCSTVGQTVTCFTPGPLSQTAPNNAITINVPVTPSASTAGTTPPFTATSSAPNEPASNAGNNGSTPMTPTTPVQTVSAPDLVTTVGQPSPALTVGQVSNIPMTTTNVGTGPASGPITSTMTLPTGVSAPASFTSGSSTCSTVGQTVTCFTAGPLSQTAPNNAITINVPVTPSASTAGTTPQFTASSSAPNEPASNMGNNGSTPMTPTTPVQTSGNPDLALTFGTPSPALTVGQLSNILVTVTNLSGLPATGQLVFTFNIPNNTTSPASYNAGNGWSCSASGASLTCVNPNTSGLNVLAMSTFNIQLTPNTGTAGQSVILNGNITPVAGETITNNNTNVTVISTPIDPAASAAITLRIKAFLQGAAVNGAGGLMRDDLRTKGLIPTAQSYTAVNGYTHIAGGGSETLAAGALTATGNDAIVDWVMVELRSASNPATVVATRSGLIQRDGDIVDVNGTSTLSFGTLAAGNYHVSVRHRNHLAITTGNAVTVSATTPLIDFTNTSLVNNIFAVGNLKRNIYPQITDSGKNMMWAGNAYNDDKVIFQGPDNDVDAIFFSVMTAPTNTSSFTNFIKNNVYDQADIDMNGQVIFQGPNNEVDLIFFEVLSHQSNTSQFLNYIIWQQLP